MFAVKFEDVVFVNDDTGDDALVEFFGLVKFSTTGPVNFAHFKDIILNNDEWRMVEDTNVSNFESYADYDSMIGSFAGAEVNLVSMPGVPPALPDFAGSLEKAWSEGVEIQETEVMDDNDSSAFGSVSYETQNWMDKPFNVITSKVKDKNRHKIILDLDVNAALIPTSTPGHHHLYIDKEVTEEQYADFINACARIGLLAEGNLNQWVNKGRQFLRLPHIRKAKGAKRPKVSETAVVRDNWLMEEW